MALLTAGYWPTTYWVKDYWSVDYWLHYAIVVVGGRQRKGLLIGVY